MGGGATPPAHLSTLDRTIGLDLDKKVFPHVLPFHRRSEL